MVIWQPLGMKLSMRRTPGGTEENHGKTSIRIANILIEIRNQYLRNRSPKHYRILNTLLGMHSLLRRICSEYA
jgi:hypothetical protein